jgi:hypothetical protein
MGLAYIGLGDDEAARATCDVPKPEWGDVLCLALAYHKLGRQPQAEALLEKMKRAYGVAASCPESDIYAQ